jgi:hypothetical protein
MCVGARPEAFVPEGFVPNGFASETSVPKLLWMSAICHGIRRAARGY